MRGVAHYAVIATLLLVIVISFLGYHLFVEQSGFTELNNTNYATNHTNLTNITKGNTINKELNLHTNLTNVIKGINNLGFEVFSAKIISNSSNFGFSPVTLYGGLSLLYSLSSSESRQEIANFLNFSNYSDAKGFYLGICRNLTVARDYKFSNQRIFWASKDVIVHPEFKTRISNWSDTHIKLLDSSDVSTRYATILEGGLEPFWRANRLKLKLKYDFSWPFEVVNVYEEDLNGPVFILTDLAYFEGILDVPSFGWGYSGHLWKDCLAHGIYIPKNERVYFVDTGDIEIIKVPMKGNLSLILMVPKKVYHGISCAGGYGCESPWTNYTVEDIVSRWNAERIYLFGKEYTSMTPERYLEIIETHLKPINTDIWIPLGSVSNVCKLRKTLEEQNLGEIFGKTNKLYGVESGLSSFYHITHIDIIPSKPRYESKRPNWDETLVIKDPFIYIIKDNKTGLILYMGVASIKSAFVDCITR